jgi:tetratricopeptide (TPR) repeat protein
MSAATTGGHGGTPRDAEADRVRLRNILATAQGGDLNGAAGMAEAALSDGIRHPMLYNLVALRLENEGRLDDAVALLHKALQVTPRDVSLLNALGLCLNRLDRWNEALAAFEEIIAIDPAFAPAHCSRGTSLEALGFLQGAEASYRRALELQMHNLAALAGMASLCSRRGDHEDARRYAEQVLALEPNYPDASQIVAAADLAAGAPQRSEERMRRLIAEPRLSPLERAIAHGFLGDALDAQGRADEAFAAYRTSNDERRRVYASRYAGGPTTREVVRWAIACVTKAPRRATSRSAAEAQGRLAPVVRAGRETARAHVFLMGFPRSGTTLLEQLLASHPDVVTLDERESLADSVRTFLNSSADLERFFDASDDELAGFREQYWIRVREAGARVGGRVFIDKHPLNTLKLPIIARLFPDTPILFARRDPRDVVLSCYRRRFRMSPPMYELLTLHGAADLYDAAMRLAEFVEAVFRLPLHVVRHEALVTDFETEVKAVCGFIGLDWTESLRDFAQRVKKNTSATPSAAQLARGLSTEGIGQWRRYGHHLRAVMPILDPWVRKFGYPAE